MNVDLNEPFGLLAIAVALFLGGILKGATGAGMPVIAVPVIAAVFDTRLAVIVLVIPNLLTNLWQVHKFRLSNHAPVFSSRFAIGGFFGAALGTVILFSLPISLLNLLLAIIIVGYVVLRLAKPEFRVPLSTAERLAPVAGFGGGVLQGTVGLSAPIAVTFANAVRLERTNFIFAVSLFFSALCVAQLPLQIAFGLLTFKIALVSTAALVPLFLGLPLGDYLGKRMDPKTFDRTILIMLALLAVRLLYSAAT